MKPVHILLCCVATSKVNLQSESAEVDRKPFGRPARSSVLILMELIGVRERVGTAHYSLFNAQLSCNGISHLSRCLLRDKCKHWKVYRAKLNYNGIHQALHCLFFFSPLWFSSHTTHLWGTSSVDVRKCVYVNPGVVQSVPSHYSLVFMGPSKGAWFSVCGGPGSYFCCACTTRAKVFPLV